MNPFRGFIPLYSFDDPLDIMRVRALFFALYRDLVGSRALDVELAHDASVADLVRAIRERGEPFDRIPEAPTVAVNLAYSSADTPLREGDEVAFIPPVAGG